MIVTKLYILQGRPHSGESGLLGTLVLLTITISKSALVLLTITVSKSALVLYSLSLSVSLPLCYSLSVTTA